MKQSVKNKANISPQALFVEECDTNSGEKPTQSAPVSRRSNLKKDNRTLVLTPQGKKVLSSDARLHLEKIKSKNKAPETNDVPEARYEVNEELLRLDKERRILAEKVKQKKEIPRLQKEIEDISGGRVSSEYQTEEHES